MLTFDHKEPKQLAECTNIIVKIPETTLFPTSESIHSSGDWIRILYIYIYIYIYKHFVDFIEYQIFY